MRNEAKRQTLIATTTLLGLALVGCGSEPISDLLGEHSAAVSAPLLSSAVKVAAPYAGTAGGALDVPSCYARSIWDMQRFGDRIYLGAGDSYFNSGATTVWSLTAPGGAVATQPELVVDDEMVLRFRHYGNTLYIPGIDATESWDFGNVYAHDGTSWIKHRSVPGALHVLDVAELDGKLYAYSTDDRADGRIHVSSDAGQTWQLLSRKLTAGVLLPMADRLLIFGYTQQGKLQVFMDGKVTTGRADLYPHTTEGNLRPPRLVRYKGTALYVAETLTRIEPAAPLLALSDRNRDPQVKFFGGAAPESVRDILVEGDTVYVLTARRNGDQFAGAVYSSTDLVSWTQLASLTVPAVPTSFELLDGAFYVGLGTEGLVYEDTTPEVEAGSIWRLE